MKETVDIHRTDPNKTGATEGGKEIYFIEDSSQVVRIVHRHNNSVNFVVEDGDPGKDPVQVKSGIVGPGWRRLDADQADLALRILANAGSAKPVSDQDPDDSGGLPSRGSAACPHCGTVWLDSDHAAFPCACCPDDIEERIHAAELAEELEDEGEIQVLDDGIIVPVSIDPVCSVAWKAQYSGKDGHWHFRLFRTLGGAEMSCHRAEQHAERILEEDPALAVYFGVKPIGCDEFREAQEKSGIKP